MAELNIFFRESSKQFKDTTKKVQRFKKEPMYILYQDQSEMEKSYELCRSFGRRDMNSY